MNRVTITLHIDLPDGVVPDVGYGEAPAKPTMAQSFRQGMAEAVDELAPPPMAPPPDLMEEAARIFNKPPDTPQCPQGHGPMKFVPAGFSKTKKTEDGQPLHYDAFWGCKNRDCKQTAKAA